jgi:hypothetical protein
LKWWIGHKYRKLKSKVRKTSTLLLTRFKPPSSRSPKKNVLLKIEKFSSQYIYHNLKTNQLRRYNPTWKGNKRTIILLKCKKSWAKMSIELRWLSNPIENNWKERKSCFLRKSTTNIPNI